MSGENNLGLYWHESFWSNNDDGINDSEDDNDGGINNVGMLNCFHNALQKLTLHLIAGKTEKLYLRVIVARRLLTY